LHNWKIHPFFILTFLYIIILILIDTTGYFLKKAEILSPVINKDIELTGTVVSEPVSKSYGTEFIVKVNEILRPTQVTLNEMKGLNDSKKRFFSRHGGLRMTESVKLLARNFDKTPDIEFNDKLKLSGRISQYQARNPGEFDYGKYLARKGIYGILNIYDFKVVEHGKMPLIYRIISSLRNRMIKSIQDNIPPAESSILLPMFIGERGALTQDLRSIFVDAGVMHVLVVSGLHVGYVVVIFWFLLRLIPVSNKIRNSLLMIPVLLYCFITGANPPVVRATVMAITLIICYLLKRDSLIYHAFALAAVFILIFNPQALFSASMQLSYVSCLGIVYILPKLLEMFKSPADETGSYRQSNFFGLSGKFTRYLITLFCVSLSAQIAVWPLLAFYFYKVSVVAILSNIIVVPLVGVVLALCFGLYFTEMFLTFFVPIFGSLCHVLTKLFIVIVTFFASIPYAIVRTGKPTVLFIIIYYILVIALFKLHKTIHRLIGFVVLLLFVILSFIRLPFTPRPLEVTFLDVGLGDCIFVKSPEGERILIDCGGDKYKIDEWTIKPFLWSQGITKIDKIFLTTSRWTHQSALKMLLQDFKVKNSSISNLEILNPGKDPSIIKLTYGKFSMLFTSDSSIESLEGLREKIGNIDILQIPRHGSGFIRYKERYEKLNPKQFVVSTNKSVDKLFKEYPSLADKLYSTSQKGALRIISDGKTYKIKPFLK